MRTECYFFPVFFIRRRLPCRRSWLTAQQAEALELLEGIANDRSFYLQMEFQLEDIHLLNSAKILCGAGPGNGPTTTHNPAGRPDKDAA
jgi:hypothetical protein